MVQQSECSTPARRTVSTHERSVHEWDTDQRLQTAVALSRLVRPTSISFRHAARIRYNKNGTVKSAFPAWLTGVDPDSWLAPKENYRDWLIKAEMEQLKALLNAPPLSGLPVRLSRALWYHEYASRTYYGEIRWITVCVALESMLHTSRGYSTRQFVERLPLMASGLGVSLTPQEAEQPTICGLACLTVVRPGNSHHPRNNFT